MRDRFSIGQLVEFAELDSYDKYDVPITSELVVEALAGPVVQITAIHGRIQDSYCSSSISVQRAELIHPAAYRVSYDIVVNTPEEVASVLSWISSDGIAVFSQRNVGGKHIYTFCPADLYRRTQHPDKQLVEVLTCRSSFKLYRKFVRYEKPHKDDEGWTYNRSLKQWEMKVLT